MVCIRDPYPSAYKTRNLLPTKCLFAPKNEQYRMNKIFNLAPGIVCKKLDDKPMNGAVPEKGQCDLRLYLHLLKSAEEDYQLVR